jgi:hypothetical protein
MKSGLLNLCLVRNAEDLRVPREINYKAMTYYAGTLPHGNRVLHVGLECWSSDGNAQPPSACYVLTLTCWVAPGPAKPSHQLNPKMSNNNTVGGIPATVIFTLIISFFAFFAAVTCVTLYYYKRDPRRLERLRRIEEEVEARDSITLGAWEETPAIWEVWADKYPKPTSKWEELLVRLPFATSPVPFRS